MPDTKMPAKANISSKLCWPIPVSKLVETN